MYKALQTFKSIGEYNNVSWLIPRIAHAELLKLETKIQPVTPLVISKIEKLLQEAEVLQQQAIDFVTLETIYDCYIRVGSLQKNTSMQANYLKKLLALKDSVYTNKKLTDGLEIAERLKTTEQQLKIAKLETANTKSNFFNYSLIAILLASIISAIAFYRNYRKQSQLKNQQLLLKQKEAFRNQLAADLHDEVGTLLTGLVMQSEMLIYQPQENSTTKLNEIGSISKEAMEQMREIVWTLDSSKDKYDNLFNKMKYLAEHQLLNKNIEHAFIIETFNSDLEILPEKRQSVYLIFKEAIANILKHSNATFVDIIIKQTKEKTYLTIKDNGTIVAKTISDGLGTNNMRNRANAINAQLSITATDGYKVELIF